MEKTITKITAMFFILLFPDQVFSQVDWYTFSNSSGTYAEITGGTQLASGSSIAGQSYNANNIGFSFTYGKTAYTQFSLSAYGFIAFGSSVSASTAPLTSGSSNNIISPMGGYLQGNSGAEIRYELTGSTPNRVLTIQWKDFRYYGETGDSYNFQVKLFETSNNVSVVYGSYTKNSTGRTYQVGLRGTSSSIYNTRTTVSNWSATTKATSYDQTCTLSNTVLPASGTTFNWTYAIAFSGGTGTSGDPYLISTFNDLRTMVQRGDIWGASLSNAVYFSQTNNINLAQTQYWDDSDDNGDGDKYNDPNDATSTGNNEGWPSIGNAWGWNTWFCANYDGGNYYVENVYINRSSGSYHGFFGVTYRMSGRPLIKNLGVVNLNFSVTSGSVGGLVGWADEVEVLNCYTTGSITTDGLPSGGLIGRSFYNIAISKCYSKCTVTSTSASPDSKYGSIGVLIGEFNGGTLSESFAEGNITANERYAYTGGLIGWFTDGTISDCFFKGNVTYTGTLTAWNYYSIMGSASGYQKNPSLTRCYSVANVTYTNFTQPTDRGFTSGSASATNNFWDNDYSNQSTATYATSKTTAEMKTQSTFSNATWDFVNKWAIDPSINNGYPYLQFYVPPVTPATQATNISFSNISYDKMTVSWTKGNGSRRVVFVKQASSGSTTVTNSTTYTANPSFGQGTQNGSSGWYCVYNGTGTQVIVTDLSPLTSYMVKVFEYNGSTGGELYISSDSTGNPANQATGELLAPATQASAVSFSSVGYTQMNISWTIGNGEKRVLFLKQDNTGTATPVNNSSYTANTAFSSGTQIGTSGWYCVYAGTGTTVTVTNLSHSTNYIAQVFEYNGPAASEKYLTSTAANNPVSQSTTVLVAPTTQAASIVFSSVIHSGMTASWTNGNGAKRIVFMKTGSTGTATPAENATYTASTAFGSGTQIGSTGWYCVLNGTESQVSVTGLSANTSYIFQVIEYNGPAGAERYLTSSSTNNPNPQQTGSAPTKRSFTCTGSVQSFTVPAGVTQISCKLWGAGGGGGYLLTAYSGGAGGYASGSLTVSPGQVIYIVVGGGGAGARTSSGANAGGYGGGGSSCTSSYPHGGGAGGGYSGIFNLSSITQVNALIIAGGGGGGRSYSGTSSGGGGGTTGGGATNFGGTQSSGGTGGSPNGSALQGGSAASFSGSDSYDGAGGGGGYFGGAGTCNSDGGGSGGGSGFLHASIISGVLTQGTTSTGAPSVAPPNPSDADYSNSAGQSGAGSENNGTAGSNGSNGLVVITWSSSLPVEIKSFNVEQKSGAVTLRWQTATEINNYGFEIERTTTTEQAIDASTPSPKNGSVAQHDWVRIGFVEGNGTTNAPKSYSFTDKSANGKTSYRLKQIDRDGKFEYSQTVEMMVVNTPKLFVLEQNYPNPFNPTTAIGYQLSANSFTTLKVYDAIGREVATLVNEVKDAGYYSAQFDGARLSSGVYFAKLTSSGKTQMRKLVLMR